MSYPVNKFQKFVLSLVGGLFMFAGCTSIVATIGMGIDHTQINSHFLLVPYLGALAFALGAAIGKDTD